MRKLILYGATGGESLRQFTLRQGVGPLMDDVKSPVLTHSSYRTRAIAISPDKTKIAMTHGGGGNSDGVPSVVIYRPISEGGLFLAYETPPGVFSGTVQGLTANNTHLVIFGASNTYLQVLDWATLGALPVPVAGLGTVRGASISPNGTLLAVLHQSAPYLRIYKMSDWSYVEPSTTAHRPGASSNEVVWSADSSRVICTGGSSSPYLTAHSAANCDRLHANTSAASIYSVAKAIPGLTADVCYMCSESAGGTYNQILRFSLSDYSVTPLPRLPGQVGVSNIAIDEVERYLYVIHNRADSSCIKRISLDNPVAYESVGEIERMVNGWSVCMEIVQKDLYQMTGSIRDIDNAPAAREIRAFRRSDGALMGKTFSNAVTGNYSMLLPDAGPYDFQFLTESGELLNDLFFANAQPQPVV